MVGAYPVSSRADRAASLVGGSAVFLWTSWAMSASAQRPGMAYASWALARLSLRTRASGAARAAPV